MRHVIAVEDQIVLTSDQSFTPTRTSRRWVGLMELLVFYAIWIVLMAALKLLEIRVDRNARRVRQEWGASVPVRIQQRMVSGDQVD